MIFSWYVSAIITILFWGIADVFYKKGTDPEDRYSHLKIAVMVGLVMGIQAIFELNKMGWKYDFFNVVKYIPVSSMYILSMTLGYAGLRYLQVSINSPISNTSGAIAGILAFIVLKKTMGTWQLIAVTMITFGLVAISIAQKNIAKAEQNTEDNRGGARHKLGAIALIFPLLYAIVDALGTFLDDVYLSKLMSPEEALISYELTFLFCGILVLIYLRAFKKIKFNIFRDKDKALAAVFETVGQFFYVYALDTNSIVVAPMIASYSIVSVILGRIFLREKLGYKQYIIIAIIMAGIFLLGLFE
ncbi:MAG: DMT family transporter [Clostridiales bacterium]|nr:DMT family transporter [Clostridiales bacterium]